MMQIGLVSLLAMVSIVSAAADPLAAARWKSGILIVFSPNAADAKLAEQRGIFKRAHTGMFERHVILLEAVGNNASSHPLRQRVGAAGKDFRALLIGKDGHTAMSSAEPLTSEVLFRAIDAMPKTRSADYIRASGYERRINRPDT